MAAIRSTGNVLLSQSEKEYITSGVAINFREDGRSRSDYRPFNVETGVIVNGDGSARVRLARTDVLVGIKLETAEPDVDFPDRGKIEFDVDCSAGASPAFVARGGEELSRDIVAALRRMVSNGTALDLKELCIVPGQRVWVAHVDALVLECGGGNLFDVVALAVRAALATTEIQVTEIIKDENGEAIDWDIVPEKTKPMTIKNFPILVTLTQIGEYHVVDATIAEEACMSGRMLIAVNAKGNTCAIHKGGQGGICPAALAEMLKLGRTGALDLLTKLELNVKRSVAIAS